ncbi:MAG TPA: cation:proton antiporter [Candidatus Eisenbacteria bacterium]|uniref:Cation:proton antiporter n=1 Tax=Eiseniibacteriota bacterium TaxID=2212470 RepID=A0A7V2AVW6_UNCEI|nr:cation:proton antiporter [Candidatus Eisenbacteria bacterium]
MNGTTMIFILTAICAGVFLCFIRMLKGPTASDRAVAVDTITTTVVSLLVLLAFVFDRYVYLDVALVYSLLSFVGLIAIARFLERGI